MKRIAIFLCWSGLLSMVGAAAEQTTPNADFAARFDALARIDGGAENAERLQTLFELAWEYDLTNYPESATAMGFAEMG